MIRDLPDDERPRERCLKHGPETLSLRECLAILIGTGPRGKGCLGLATELLSQHHLTPLPNEFYETTKNYSEIERLMALWQTLGTSFFDLVPGVGSAQKARLLASFEIARRYQIAAAHESSIVIPKELRLSVIEKKVLTKISSEDRSAPEEWFGFVGVYKTGETTSLRIVSRGTARSVTIDRQKLFREILMTTAPGFILLHNHPSGDLEPSQADIELTNELSEVAQQLDLRCVSHFIVSSKGFRSVI